MAKKKKTSYEEWLRQNDSGVVRTADAVVTTMRGIQNTVQNATQRSRLNKYNTPGFNPYQDYNTAVQYGKDLQSMYDSYKGRNLFVNSLKAGQNPLDAYRQESLLKNAITRHNTYMDGIADEAAFNEQIAYPMRYQGLTSAAGVNARLKGMQQTISGLRQTGQTEKANALQAEYDWLSQRQYDYWTEDDYKKNIAYLEGEIGKQEDRMSSGGGLVWTPFGYVATNEYAGTDLTEDEYQKLQQRQARNARELSRLENLKTQLSNLQATKEQNAYRDVMKDWSEQDFADMEELARLTDARSGARKASRAGAGRRSRGTHSMINGYNERISELEKKFLDKGYSEEEVDAIVAYFIRDSHAMQRQKDLQELQDWGSQNFWTGLAASAASVPLSLAGGYGYADIALQNATAKTDPFTGDRQRIDQYSAGTIFSDASSAIRSAVGEKINSPVGNLVYQAAMSFADSFVAMQSGEWVGEAMLGLSAATQATRDAYARGATDTQALVMGGMAGLAESLFEHISIDKLRIMQTGSAASRKTIREFALDWVKQSFTEASEEGATDIANLISDAIIMGDKSELNTMIKQYRDSGMSESDATVQAWKDWGSQLFQDMAAGFLSGGMGTVVYTGIGTFQRNAGYVSEGRKILDAGNASALKELGAALPEGSYGRGLAENVNAEGTNRKTARQLGAIASELNQNTLRQGVQSRLEQLGVTNASETATAIMRELNEQTTTKAQDQLLKSKAAQRVLSEFKSAAEGSTSYTNEWAYDALYENAERGRNLRTNDEAVKEVAEFAKDYGRHEEAVNKLFKLQSDMPVESFKTGFDAAYTMGKNGVDMEQAMTATATQRMSETQRALAWEIGRSAANTTTTNNEEGADINGKEGSVSVPGGGERYDGARAEESVGKLAEGAEPAARNGQVLSRSAKDSGAADLKYEVNPVSTADFGIAGGTKNKSLYRVSENQKLTPAVQAAVDTAKANGRNIVLFGGGNLEVRDGDAIASVRGMYDPNTNTMYVRVDHSRYTAEQIAKHENGHGLIADGRITVKEVQDYMKRTMDEEALDQALADYADAYDGIQMTDEALWHEIICDALGNMNIFEGITGFSDYAERAEQRGEAIRNAAAEMQKGRAPPAEADNTQKLSRETDREIVQTLGAGARVDANKDGQLIFAQSKDKHTVAFSIETLNNGGRRKLQKALEENGHTTEEIRDVLQHIEDTVTFIADLGVEYEGKGYENLRQNLYADIITDVRTHKQVLSTLVRNGDYPVNLDLALVCKKRVAYMRMISRLVQDGVLEKVTFGGDAIAKVNDILRKNGFETACLGCFVEARRLQIQNWAESIVNEWNRQVDKRVKNAPDFGFAAGKTANLSADDLDAIEDEYKGAKLNEKGNKKLKQASVENKMGQLLDTTPSLLKHLRVEDLLTPAGISALRRRDGTLFSLVQQRYGAASPKIVQDFNPYNGEIADLSFKFIKDRNGEGIGGSKKYIDAAVRQLGGRPTKNKGESNAEFAKRKADFDRQAENMAMRKYLYDIGGARMQSFSDFMIENVFDYVQMFADLAAKRLPMHGYSKEIMALRLFGMTGAKWNGSLIAHAERSMGKELAGLLPAKEAANGRGIVVTDPMTGKQYAICFDDYQRHKATGSFIQSIGMKDIFALQLDPRYSSNVGSITIGVSDAQIRAMLNHPLFSMVIPYHKSGMIKEYAIRVGVDMYNDYTEYQNTRIGKVYDRNGNEVEELIVKDKVVHADTHFDFNEAVQRLGDAKAAADEYIAWCAEKHPVYSGKKVIGYETFLPKFSDSPEGYDFTKEENYYKLLEDFTSYDSITGESAVQGDVRMVFPEKDGLSAQEIEEYKQRLRDTGIYTDAEINRYAQRAQMSFQDLVREAVEERLQYKKATEPNWESTVQEVEKALLSDKSARSTPEERQKKRDAKKGNEQSFSRDLSTLDSDYMTAVEKGDVETAQRMVDEAAKEWGAYSANSGSPIHFYHGTRGRFYVFEKARQGQNYGGDSRLGKGFYFAHTKTSAKEWARGGNRIVDAYLQMRRPLDLRNSTPDDIAKEINKKYQQKQNEYEDWFPISKEQYKENLDRLRAYDLEHPGSFIDSFKYDKNGKMTDGIREFLSSLGYDGIISDEEAVVFEPDQIKSADPVTYDDNGKVIPLSERFNPENADIRFSRELDTFTNKDDVDAEISHLKDQIRDIQNAQYAARDQAKSDPRVVEAQKRMWAAEDEKGYSGSFKERVEYRRILNKVKAEMETDIPDGDLNELAKRVKDLEELREQFLKVTPITNAQYQKLVDHFGTTEDYGVAGFILRDGRMLDFSGKKQYGSAYAGGREIYHNEIGDVLKLQSDTSPRINMVSNGNIRLVPEINGINLSQTPTAEQAKALRGFIEHYNGSVHVDIDNAAGRTVETFGYRKGTSASKILSDINSYFKTGASPAPQSELLSFYTENNRYSRDLENLDELREENNRLKKRLNEMRRGNENLQNRLDAAKQQTKRTTEPTLREDDVRKAARGLLKEMDSTLKVDDVADDMKALGEYMMRGESKRERAPSWEEVKRRASEIAERIVDNASALSEASDVELYKELRNYLRTTKLTLAEADRADMQDGYAEFVKRNFNRIKLGNDGLPVDSAYQELQEMYGKGLFPTDITHPADQLMHIEDVLNGLRPVYENPHSYHRQEAVAWAANAVIDTLLSEDVRQTAPTFADKAEARREKDVAEAVAWERYKGEQREDRLKERYAKRMKDALQKAKERRARDIDRLVLKQKFKESARKERSARTALWNKILDLKKVFRRMVEKPQQADSKHAPLRLARALDGVTNCFSVENRERILPISELDRALGKLRDVYKLAEKDDELALYYDEGLIDNIDAVRTMLNEVDPFDATLDSQKLQKVYDLLKMCKHNVTTANQFVSRNWAKTIIEAGRKWAAEIASASIIFKKGFSAQLLNYQLRPDSMFARFSGFAKNSVGEQIQEMFVDGEEKMLRIQQDFYYAFERFSKSKEFDKLTRHGKASLLDVGLKDENGNAIKLTRDQMLALYMNLRSEDNILALAYGGADIPSVSTYYTGKVAKSFDDSVRTVSIDANVFKLIDEARNLADEAQGENVTDERRQEIQQRLDELQSEVKALEQEAFTNLFGVKAKIEKQLTKFEKDLVEAADEWMMKSKDYINAETKAMYGIEKAQVEHYWPIHRNMNFVNTDMRTAVNEINLENWGSLKERVKSHAPIKLAGFIFELDNHTKKMSQFCGFAAAQRDFNKLYQTRMPYQHSTLKEQIAKKFGSDSGLIGVSGMEYIDNYIAAVSGGGDATKPSVLAWARRNLPRATLSANIRVALSQVASVPTAAAEVGWGAMAKGFARYSLKGFSGKQIEALAKADPWFWQRSRGDGGMREFAEMKESTFALDRGYNKIAGTKVGKALLNWCQKFDMYATYTQWAMAEEWVKQNRKDLKKGSEAFDEAVSRKYRDILRRTQPNYTVTERSDLLRDKRESMKWATMYKTQSNQNLNILYDATARLRQYTRDFKNGKNGVTQQDVADARRQFARAYSGVILGGTVTFVLFRAFANALLHAMNAYRDDDDKELTLESFLEGLGEETLGAISGMFLFGSEIEEFVFAAVTHGKYWGLSDSAISAISDVVKNLYNLTQDPSEEKILKFVNSLAAPLGLPISNVKKIVDGIGYHIEDIRNGEFLSFDAGVNRTAQQQASRFAKAMEDGDTAKMKRIYDEMVATSKAKDPEANTQDALRGQIKDAFIGTDGKATLSESEALKLLEKFGGKTGDEAKDILNKWKFEKEFGYEYKELGDRYIAGELSDSEYKNALMNYGGKSEEDADEIVGKKKLVREYGFEYSEDNIVDAAIAGDITTDEAYDIWTNYGGVSEREAENRATRLQFVVDNPGIAYDDAKIGMVTDYDEYVAAAKGANIKPLSAEDFSEYWLAADALSSDYDANGNPIKGSERKDKVFAYIASLDIPAEQKTAIALSMYAAKTVSKMKTW